MLATKIVQLGPQGCCLSPDDVIGGDHPLDRGIGRGDYDGGVAPATDYPLRHVPHRPGKRSNTQSRLQTEENRRGQPNCGCERVSLATSID